MNGIDVLAIFAHPDDVELTVGGTLLKLKSLGYKTGALDVTKGEMGTRGTVEGRAAEAEQSSSSEPFSVSSQKPAELLCGCGTEVPEPKIVSFIRL